MSILSEWFRWGESDLFGYGVLIVLFSALAPMRPERRKFHFVVTGLCLAVWLVCECMVADWYRNLLRAYFCLFVGGFALSVALGRILRFLLSAWLGKRRRRRERRNRGPAPGPDLPDDPSGKIVQFRDWRKR